MTHVIFVLKSSINNIRDNFHIPMRMGWKSFATHYDILINNPKALKPFMSGIIIISERESMFALKPIKFCQASVKGSTELNHLLCFPLILEGFIIVINNHCFC